MWLKIWFSTLEAAEEENSAAFEVDEAEEDAFIEKMREVEHHQLLETRANEARAKQAAIASTVVRRSRYGSSYGYS